MCCTTAKYGGQESFIMEPYVAFCILIHGRGIIIVLEKGMLTLQGGSIPWGDVRVEVRVRAGFVLGVDVSMLS